MPKLLLSVKSLSFFHEKALLANIYYCRLAILQPLVYNHSCNKTFQIPLQKSFHRPGAELRAVAFVYYMVFSLLGELDSNSFLCQALPQFTQHQFKNVLEFML